MKEGLLARLRAHGGLVLLLAVTLAVYLPALGHSFLTTWDDDKYVVANGVIRGFSGTNLRLAFTGWSVGNYAPIQIISYMADYTLWGLRPGGFIATNILLHMANGLLFHRLLREHFTGRVAPLVATALFLLHPVQVESVAWVSQRKNLLAMGFFLVALLCYRWYRQRPRGGRRWHYALSMAAFMLALLSKPVSAILPLVLVLSDYCHLPKGAWKRFLPDKIPFLLLALGAGFVAMQAQGAGGGLPGFHGGSAQATLFTMLPVFCRYLEILFLPWQLSAMYAPPLHAHVDPAVVMAAVVLLLLLGAGIWLARRKKHLFFWYGLFFLGLLPVSQVIPLVTLMNDRYLYFPLLGAAPLAGALAAGLVTGGRGARLAAVPLFCALLLLPLLSRQRVHVWRDDRTLWQDTVHKSPLSSEAWNGLGAAEAQRKNYREAAAAYRRSLALTPGMSAPLNNLGVALMKSGDLADSRYYLHLLTERYPQMSEGYINLALNYSLSGDLAAAERAWSKAMELEPASASLRLNAAQTYAWLKIPATARLHYRAALTLGADPEAVKKGLQMLDTLYGREETR